MGRLGLGLGLGLALGLQLGIGIGLGVTIAGRLYLRLGVTIASAIYIQSYNRPLWFLRHRMDFQLVSCLPHYFKTDETLKSY